MASNNGKGRSPKVGDTELSEILAELTDMEQAFSKIMVFNKGISQTEALIQAGSKASRTNATKLASEMLKRPHVQKYIEYLEDVRAIESGIELDEIIANARKAIDMAFMAGKPRDADPHNRLLAELGGFLRTGQSSSNNTQVNVSMEDSSLKGDAIDADFQKLKNIVGISKIDN